MDVTYINPFIGATRYIFNVMLGLRVNVGEIRACKDFVPMQNKVAAVIPMRGGVDGALVLLFQKSSVISIAQILDDTVQSVEQSLDSLGELANIITGNAKKEVADRLVEITAPTITIEECDSAVTSLSPWVIVPFESPNCSFELLVSFAVHDSHASEKEDAGEKEHTDHTTNKANADVDNTTDGSVDPAVEKQNAGPV